MKKALLIKKDIMTEILKVTKEEEYIEIEKFFLNIWKEEFEIDASNQINKYKSFCEIYYIKNDLEIISAIIAINSKKSVSWKNYIWRFATLKKYRWKWLWTKLLNYLLQLYTDDIILDADEKQVNFYKKFWFIETGDNKEIWNTMSFWMFRNKI